jgi:hypothetical protein
LIILLNAFLYLVPHSLYLEFLLHMHNKALLFIICESGRNKNENLEPFGQKMSAKTSVKKNNAILSSANGRDGGI